MPEGAPQHYIRDTAKVYSQSVRQRRDVDVMMQTSLYTLRKIKRHFERIHTHHDVSLQHAEGGPPCDHTRNIAQTMLWRKYYSTSWGTLTSRRRRQLFYLLYNKVTCKTLSRAAVFWDHRSIISETLPKLCFAPWRRHRHSRTRRRIVHDVTSQPNSTTSKHSDSSS